jgi:hypothetical protein
MAVYFIVIEEDLGVRPPYGIVVSGDESPYKVGNTGGGKGDGSLCQGADKGTGVNGIKGTINSVPGLALSEKWPPCIMAVVLRPHGQEAIDASTDC